MQSNTGPTAGGGVMKPKNANCEGGVELVIYIFCRHIIDSHGTQYTLGISKICKGTRPRCRSAQKNRFECRRSKPPFVGVKNTGAWRYMSLIRVNITAEGLLTALDHN